MERNRASNDEMVMVLPNSFSQGSDASSPGEEARVAQQCTFTISYAKDRPESPALRFSGDECVMNAEIALAFALATFLRMSAAALPR